MYRIAVQIEPSAEAQAGLDQVLAEKKHRAEEARRRPVIGPGLEQEHLVRARRSAVNRGQVTRKLVSFWLGNRGTEAAHA